MEVLREYASGPAADLLAAGARAQLMIGWASAGVVVVMLCVSIALLVGWVRHQRKLNGCYDDSLWGAALGVAAGLFLLGLLIFALEGAPRLAAPEWYAVAELIH